LYGVLMLLFGFVPPLMAQLPQTSVSHQAKQPRKLGAIVCQPQYLQSLAGSSLGYALMILLMTDTPLAMQHMGHTSAETSWVIQWHVLGMFVPSFFTGSLVDRWGHRPVLSVGLVALAADAVVAVFFQGLWSFWLSLTLLGIGWNFLYVASTSRLTLTYQVNEKEKSQAAHDLAVFILATVATWSAAPLLQALTWRGLHLWALPLLGATSLAVLWPTKLRRNP
jgi:MFS family permease